MSRVCVCGTLSTGREQQCRSKMLVFERENSELVVQREKALQEVEELRSENRVLRSDRDTVQRSLGEQLSEEMGRNKNLSLESERLTRQNEHLQDEVDRCRRELEREGQQLSSLRNQWQESKIQSENEIRQARLCGSIPSVRRRYPCSGALLIIITPHHTTHPTPPGKKPNELKTNK